MQSKRKNREVLGKEETSKYQDNNFLTEEENKPSKADERVDFFSELLDEEENKSSNEVTDGVRKGIAETKTSDDDFLDLFDDIESGVAVDDKANAQNKDFNALSQQENSSSKIESKESKLRSSQLSNKFDGLRKLSDVFKTRKGKYIILGSCVAAMAIMVSVSALIMHNTNKVETESKAKTKEKYLSSALETDEKVDLSSGVLGWCNAVLCDDFETCDAITGAGRYGTLGYQYEITSNDVSSAVYDMMLTKVSESISTIKVTDREELENGSVVYSLGVSYRPYNDITGISIDTDKLQSLCDDYIRNKYDADEFKKEVQELYQDWFKSCFTKQAKDYLVTIKLVQQENEDGSISVQNTNTAFTELLNITGVSDIEKVYETNLINEIAPVMSVYS